MRIRFSGLNLQYERLKSEIDKTIRDVFRSGKFILSDNVKRFEANFSRYCGTEYAVGVASGTEAISLSLKACGIGSGDEVITVPNSAIPTICAITMVGAKPSFVDVGEDYLIDLDKIELAITERTKAIIPVHLYGMPCQMDVINRIAKKYNLVVIEDAAQAHGSVFKGKKAGSLGDLGCFSFYPTKNLGAYGDAGLITTNNARLFKKLLRLRDYGRSSRDRFDTQGINSRLDEIQAACLNVKLKYLELWNKRRRKLALLYNKLLDPSHCILPRDGDGKISNYHLYVIRVKKRNQLKEYLRENGIETFIYYPIPAHLQKAFRSLNYRKGDFFITERNSRQILSLPLYPELSECGVEYTADKINRFFKG